MTFVSLEYCWIFLSWLHPTAFVWFVLVLQTHRSKWNSNDGYEFPSHLLSSSLAGKFLTCNKAHTFMGKSSSLASYTFEILVSWIIWLLSFFDFFSNSLDLRWDSHFIKVCVFFASAFRSNKKQRGTDSLHNMSIKHRQRSGSKPTSLLFKYLLQRLTTWIRITNSFMNCILALLPGPLLDDPSINCFI